MSNEDIAGFAILAVGMVLVIVLPYRCVTSGVALCERLLTSAEVSSCKSHVGDIEWTRTGGLSDAE